MAEGLAERSDEVLLVAGDPFGVSGTTNTLQVRRVRRSGEAAEPELRRWEQVRPEGVFCYEIAPESCMSCGICVSRCPAGIWTIEGGVAAVVEARLSGCVLEHTCERDCPAGAIRIRRTANTPTDESTAQETDDEA